MLYFNDAYVLFQNGTFQHFDILIVYCIIVSLRSFHVLLLYSKRNQLLFRTRNKYVLWNAYLPNVSRYLVEISAILAFFWPKFGCHGNRPCFPENSDSIFEFADLKNPTVQAKNVLTSCAELKSVHFGLFLPKFGCHGNSLHSLENADSILVSADHENPTTHAKSVSIWCTELKLVRFWLIFGHIWLPWQPPLLP